eukprot:Seg2028.6 transcript_id=Seg2028.6/GoldUCD/mRNA.D3Y31 product="hypothetical protein" protein_id=Seg2028.6/GoldUCD/D3Y31
MYGVFFISTTLLAVIDNLLSYSRTIPSCYWFALLSSALDMGKGKASSAYRRRKRKYYGNQHENVEKSQESCSEQAPQSPILLRPTADDTLLEPRPCDESEAQCSSAKKLKLDKCLQSFERNDFNFIVGFCPDCKGSLELQDDQDARSGFVHRLALRCTKCNWVNRFFTSKLAKKDDSAPTRCRSRFDLSVRSVLAFREIGRGYEGMQTLAIFMNISPPVTRSNYDAINQKLHVALKETTA